MAVMGGRYHRPHHCRRPRHRHRLLSTIGFFNLFLFFYLSIIPSCDLAFMMLATATAATFSPKLESLEKNGLKFENIYLYSKSLQQPKYKFLELVLNGVNDVKYFPFNEHEEVVSPSEAKSNSIFIFDDIACDKQDNARAFYLYNFIYLKNNL